MKYRSKKGFTLAELLIVVAIIAVLVELPFTGKLIWLTNGDAHF